MPLAVVYQRERSLIYRFVRKERHQIVLITKLVCEINTKIAWKHIGPQFSFTNTFEKSALKSDTVAHVVNAMHPF